MPCKNERLACYGVLRTVIASFEVHSYLLSQLPMPKDSNDYREGLIYLFCNNYLTFHVFKTSFNEIMAQLLRFARKRRQTC